MTKNNTNKTAFDDILNSAKSESKAVKNIIENQATSDVESAESTPEHTGSTEKQEVKQLVIKPVSKETRSKKTNILLTPTLDKLAREKAIKEGVSLNEVVNQLLEIWVNA